jgi:hypothetical protein
LSLGKRTVAIGHWETLNGHGEKVRLVRQRISAKCQESPFVHDGEYVKKRQGPERAIQERLHQELGGEMEAWTAIGPVDLVTPTEIIEIKRIEDWKTAVGQVLTKSQTYPQHKKRIHLFGESSQQLKKIISNCQAFEVVVTFELLNLKTAAV